MPEIRPLSACDRDWVFETLTFAWGAPIVVTPAGTHDASHLPGFLAIIGGRRAGLVTYAIADGECDVVTLNSMLPGRGVGTALLEAVKATAAAVGCRRLWLVMTNDNTRALCFYQRRGWDLVAVHRNVLAAWRRRKPSIPERGLDGIPLRHALELEFRL